MQKWKWLTLIAMLTTATAAGAGAALAHSFPQEQTPAAGQTVTTPPREITIKFDAPIEKLFARLEVLDQNGSSKALGEPIYGSDGSTLSIKVAPLKPGDYTVKWTVVGADTHRTQGSYTFTVAPGSA